MNHIPTISAKQAVKEIADVITGKRTVREINESYAKKRVKEQSKMFVYVVTAGQYSDYVIRAILSTRDLAEKYIQSHTEGYYDIEEWELDAD